MRHKTYTVPLLTLIVIVSFLLLGGGAASVWAQQASRVVAVSVGDVNGRVEVLSKDEVPKGADAQILSAAWKRITPKASLNAGDQVRTDVDASLQLHLNDGTLLTLGSDTLLRVEELKSARGTTPRTAIFALDQGTISTRQTSKILGQTVQIIRTENGEVNTRLGEVEVHKPQQRYPKLAALPTQWPLFVQNSGDQNRTTTTLIKGTAEIESTGIGQMVTNSAVLPDTCLANDGVLFTLKAPKEKVKIAKLPDTNGFELTSVTPFQLLVGTEGQANKIKIVNRAELAEVDIEGISIAEMRDLSTLNLGINPLLTVGVTSTNMTVALNCTDQESRGLEFEVLGSDGGVTMLRNTLGAGISRSPSRGAVVTPRPTFPPFRTPTPTPTEEPDKTPTPGRTPVPTATPTQPTGPRPTPAPTRIPVTHNESRNPVLSTGSITDPVVASASTCGGPNTYDVSITFHFSNFLPQIMPGRLHSFVNTGRAPSYFSIISYPDVTLANYTYSDATQREEGDITYHFCFNPSVAPPNSLLDVRFYVFDREGNQSNTVTCTSSGPLPAGPFTCTP